jgi:hypothetical protein
MFGVGRWSKLRSQAKKLSKPLSERSDDDLRAYSNFFIISIASCLKDNNDLLESVVALIETTDSDPRVECNANDFGDNFTKQAEKWAKRLNLLYILSRLVKSYKASKAKFQSIPY